MGSKILLADDSITIQKVVNLTFIDEGIEVVAVSNGDVAERRLDEIRPDLVLADIFMPGKNGYELCESIKQNPQFRNVPVVLLVGAFEPFDQAEARRVRADAHLTKPFESRTLVETVRKLINASAHTTAGPVAVMNRGDESRDDTAGEHKAALTASISSTSGGLTAQSTPKLDLSAMMADTSAPATASARTTDELSSRMGDLRSESFHVSVTGAQAHESVTATLIDTDEPFETMEFASSEFAAGASFSSFALDTNEPILDFDRSEFSASPAHQPAQCGDLSFETEPDAVVEVEVNPPVSEAQTFDPIRVETSRLDLPSAEEVWDGDAETSKPGPQSGHFEMNLETAFEPQNEAAGSSLLAAEEPLGDLLDETGSLEPRPAQGTSSTNSLNLELTELGTFATAPDSPTQFDLIDTPEALSSEAPAAEEVEKHQTPPPSRARDWTSPRAGAYSTAQLDSVVMPIETAAYLAQDSLQESARSEASEEASFSTSARWTEEEARFTAIDIEAVPVEEQDAHADSYIRADALPHVERTAESSAEEPANGAASTSDLSAAAIEEIVRRVIAEMSDSVVREVAWEVVPDCVERVVDQLTRESLSKPT